MSENEKKSNPKPAASTDGGQDEVQHQVDQANAQGYWGVTTDPTPDENYTVSGVTKGLPTPETDEDARVAARKVSGYR
jgi:hypothetical protein